MTISVLEANNNEMIIGNLSGRKELEGIYIEVKEKNVPEKNRIMDKELHGEATFNGDYMRSNTHGATCGKYFKKVSEMLDYEPICKNELDEFSSIKNNWEKAYEILKQIDKDSLYFLSYDISCPDYGEDIDENIFTLKAKRSLKRNEIKAKEHEFKEYEENFKGMYGFDIIMEFNYLNREQTKEIAKLANKHRIKVDLETLNSIVNKYNLNLNMECTYTKYRTNL